jgi:hypothetical protein
MIHKLKEIFLEQEKDNYLSLLTEDTDKTFYNLSKHFSNYNKLSGDLNEDKEYLNNFIKLMEEDDDFDPFEHLKNTDKVNVEDDCILSISKPNEKLDHPNFSLPAGYTCPFADICKTLTPKDRKKIDNKLIQRYGEISCYAAGEEARYPPTQNARWRNYDLLKKMDYQGKVDLILKSLKYYEQNEGLITLFRIHGSGDFYSLEYFDVWAEVARQRPDIIFYAYTKSLPFWIIRKYDLPDNLKLVASIGGKRDELITKHKLRNARVVNSPEEAKKLKLKIDIDDTLAHSSDEDFALLIHGTQKAGTEEAKAAYRNQKLIKNLKKGIYNYETTTNIK